MRLSSRHRRMGAMLAVVTGVAPGLAVIGAVGGAEPASAATFTVNRTGEGSDSSPGNGACFSSAAGGCTLRAAVEEANARPGSDVITVPAGTYTLTKRLTIEDSVQLNGAGASSTIISGGGTTAILRVATVEYLVCDSTHDRVWSYDRNGQRNSSFISPGSGGLDNPTALTIGPSGPDFVKDIFVTGLLSGVHRFDGRTGASESTPVTSGEAGVDLPSDTIFGPSGMYVAQYYPNGKVAKFTEGGTSTGNLVAPGGGGLVTPNSMVIRSGSLYVTDASAAAVRKYDATTGTSQGTFVPPFSGGLDTPRGLMFAPDGSLLVSSWANDSVKRYNGTTGAFLGTLVSTGSGGLDRPTDLELGPDGSLLVVSSATKQVLQYDLTTGAFRKIWAQGGSGVFLDSPSCLVRREQIGDGPTVNITGVTFASARADTGDPGAGVLVDEGAYASLTDSVVRDNNGSVFGAGISNWGTMLLRRVAVKDNALPEGGGGQTSQGGGIFNVGNLTIERSSIVRNIATRGGGISQTNSGRTTITNSTISGNKVWGAGGGIRNVANGRFDISFSTITGNEANRAGGFGESERRGGGIYNEGADARIAMAGTIVAKNIDNRSSFDGNYGPDCVSLTTFNFTSERGNLIGILTPNCVFRDVTWGASLIGDITGTPAAPLDPKLGTLSFDTVPSHPLLSGSPAIDGKTSGSASPISTCPGLDQKGTGRPIDGNADGSAVCDIGAIEYVPADDGDGVSAAIENAAPNSGDLNADGVKDALQANVASLPNAENAKYSAVVAPAGRVLRAIANVKSPAGAPTAPGGLVMGTFSGQVTSAAGGLVTFTISLPSGLPTPVDTFLVYGPEPGKPANHWWELTSANSVGFSIGGGKIAITLRDGGRGDSDGLSDGVVTWRGAPATAFRCDGRLATIVGTNASETINGTDGDDVIVAKKGNDVVWAKKGNDRVCGWEGDDVLHGGDGDDVLIGGAGTDTLDGGSGNNTLIP